MVNGELDQTITNPGSGVIRVPFEFEASGENCVQVYAGASEASLSMSGFVNDDTVGETWSTGASPSVTLNFPVTDNNSKILYGDYNFIVGGSYTITVFTTVGGSGSGSIRVLDDDLNTLDFDIIVLVGGGDKSFSFTAPSGASKIGFSVSGTSLSITLSDLRITLESTEITERICIDVIEECGETFNNELRITDGEDLRRV
jgi:hypothetical protein